MSLSKSQVREAFRAAALREFADVPPEASIDHTFSEEFFARRAELMAKQKRRSLCLLPRRKRHALVVAAILAASLLLVAFSPVGQQKLGALFLQMTEGRVDYTVEGGLREEIETTYTITELPEGFTLVEQEQETPYFAHTAYEDANGTRLAFNQFASTAVSGTLKHNENGQVLTVEVDGHSVMIYLLDTMAGATWVEDGYMMMLNYLGVMDKETLLALVAAVEPAE